MGSPRTKRLLDTAASAGDDAARRDYALFHLLLATGVRLTSALALEVGDVDLDRGELELRETKGDRPERAFLSKAVCEHLRVYTDGRTGLLFPGRGGKRLSRRHVHRRLREWLERAGVKRRYSPHSLRHAFAMGLYARTGDVLLVQAALHHRSIHSTLVYARASGERLRRALG